MAVESYDFYCVDFAKRLIDLLKPEIAQKAFTADDLCHILTGALNVLGFNGLYAFALYATWRKNSGTEAEKKIFMAIDQLLFGPPKSASLLRLKDFNFRVEEASSAIEMSQILCRNLDDLFLAKDLLERTLTYARFHAKAL